MRTYSPDIIAQLRQLYITGNWGIKALAAQSAALVGQAVDSDDLEIISRKDRWPTLKTRTILGKEGLPQDEIDEIDDLKRLLYDAITNADDPPSPRELPGLIRAYRELSDAISASGISVSSAKTPLQQAIEVARRAIDEQSDHSGR